MERRSKVHGFDAEAELRWRILHVAEVLHGGVGTVLEELAGFQRCLLGCENVHFLVPKGERLAKLRSREGDGVTGFSRPSRSVGSLIALRSELIRLCRRFRPDIIHAHSTFAGLHVRTLSRRTLGESHTVYSPQGWPFVQKVSSANRAVFRLVEQSLAARTDLILCASEQEREDGRQAGISPHLMRVVRNGVSPSGTARVDPRDVDATGPVELLFVGRFDHQKGFDILLRALERLDQSIRLTVIGGLARSQRRISLPASVSAKGWLPREELDAYYAAADAVVMPSRWEGLPFVALEALRNGTPVIGSPIGSLREVIEDGVSGIVVRENSVSEWTEVLHSLSRSTLQGMRVAAISRFKDHFSAQAMNGGFLSAYRDVLGSGVGASWIGE